VCDCFCRTGIVRVDVYIFNVVVCVCGVLPSHSVVCHLVCVSLVCVVVICDVEYRIFKVCLIWFVLLWLFSLSVCWYVLFIILWQWNVAKLCLTSFNRYSGSSNMQPPKSGECYRKS
jgi:hypothetical protein